MARRTRTSRRVRSGVRAKNNGHARPGKRGDANKFCHCGSRRKYKHCCLQSDQWVAKKLGSGVAGGNKSAAIRVMQAMLRSGTSRAHVFAFNRCGTIVNDINRDILPAETLAKWDAAVAEYELENAGDRI